MTSEPSATRRCRRRGIGLPFSALPVSDGIPRSQWPFQSAMTQASIETNRFEVDERVIDRLCAIHHNSRSELLSLRPQDLLELGVVPEGLEGRIPVDPHIVAEAGGNSLLNQVDRAVPISQRGG